MPQTLHDDSAYRFQSATGINHKRVYNVYHIVLISLEIFISAYCGQICAQVFRKNQ